MPQNSSISAFLLALIVLVSACSQKEIAPAESSDAGAAAVINGVPFVRQKDKFCGPAAMASVLAYYGREISQEEIAERVYTPKLKGALISDMENFAREQGMSAAAINGDKDALTSAVDEGAPVIVLVDRGVWKVSVPHYYVVYGYAEDGEIFILHTGDEGALQMGYDELDGEWRKMNRLMLVIKK